MGNQVSADTCPSKSPCDAPVECYFYRDGKVDGEGCWGELDKRYMTCPRGWERSGETNAGCAINHYRPLCKKNRFSRDPVDCCFESDGTDTECSPGHCKAKQTEPACVEAIENYCTDYDPSKPDNVGDRVYDRMSKSRCQTWARSGEMTAVRNGNSTTMTPVHDRPRVKDAVFKYCSSRPGMRDPFCRCVNAGVPALCPFSRRCAEPGRDCCYAWRFRNDPAMLEQAICFADECKGARSAGAFTWTPTGCSDVCAPILQFKGQLTSDKRITALVDCGNNELSPVDQQRFFGSTEAYARAQEEARERREHGQLALVERDGDANGNAGGESASGKEEDDDDAAARSILEASLRSEVTRIVADATTEVFAEANAACVQRLSQVVSLALGERAELRSCGPVEAVARANVAFACMQDVGDDERRGQIAQQLAARIVDGLGDESPTLTYLANEATASDDGTDSNVATLPSTDVLETKLAERILATTTAECRQDRIQTLNVELGAGASVVSGCNADQLAQFGALCRREQDRIAEAIARGDSTDDIVANVDAEARDACRALGECCDPSTQGISFQTGLNLDESCTQVRTLVDVVVQEYASVLSAVAPEALETSNSSSDGSNNAEASSSDALANTIVWAMIGVAILVLVVAIVIGAVMWVTRKRRDDGQASTLELFAYDKVRSLTTESRTHK